jgi:hypothetical protein
MSFLYIPMSRGSNGSNTFVGVGALQNVTTGVDNSAFGFYALNALVSGNRNTAVGSEALLLNTSSNNTAVGSGALRGSTTGQNSVALGQDAMRAGNPNNGNVAVGYSAMYNCGLTENSVGIGQLALYNAAGTIGNTAVGNTAGLLITTGSKNTILGAFNGNQGGLDIRTASNYCVISDGDGNPRLYIDNTGLVTAPGGFSGGGGGGAITFNNQTAAYTVVSGDLGKIINCTAGTFTVSLTAAATLGSGFNCWVWNTGSGVITIDPNGAETIDGNSTIILRKGEGMQIVCNGANWETGDKKTMRAYAENFFDGSINTRPNASGGGSVAIGATSTSSGSSSLAMMSGTASGTDSVAIGGGATASSNQSTAIGKNSSNQGSVAATGAGAASIGGSYASGADSFAAAVGNNTSSYGAKGANSLAMGRLANATIAGNIAIGDQASATGFYSIAIGNSSTSSSNGSLSLGSNYSLGWGASASAANACAIGDGARAREVNKYAFAGWSASTAAGVQFGLLILTKDTTDATASVLASNAGTAGVSNQLILPNSSAYAFTGTIVARQQAAGGTQSAAWTVSGLIRREANAASTTLVASTVNVISNVPGWTLALSADTTNGGLAVTATGAVGTNIRWNATMQTSEVTYA